MAKKAQAIAKSELPILDFSNYSLRELLDTKKDIENEIQSRQAKEIEDLRAKVAETAQAFGISIEEVMGIARSARRATRHARGRQPARYRGPNGEEWSGRGPAPRWMKPFLEQGKTKEDFLIRDAEAPGGHERYIGSREEIAKPNGTAGILSARQSVVLEALRTKMDAGRLAEVRAAALAGAANIPLGSLHSVLVSLEKKHLIEITRQGTAKAPAVYRVL